MIDKTVDGWKQRHSIDITDPSAEHWDYQINKDGTITIGSVFSGKLMHAEWVRIAEIAALIVETTEPSAEETAYLEHRAQGGASKF